ncbi:unnamed protein product [Trichogramma brassicae]|uniref:Reverse transcriptase domain-containing protein n=1 Tax=Trichogramma brassicae TaxID=86971 RepID=A0A6H5IPM7_9HYME|nr:unnamed protein product [Trichogramma brassicae]
MDYFESTSSSYAGARRELFSAHESLREYFAKYGDITEVMVMKDPTTRRSSSEELARVCVKDYIFLRVFANEILQKFCIISRCKHCAFLLKKRPQVFNTYKQLERTTPWVTCRRFAGSTRPPPVVLTLTRCLAGLVILVLFVFRSSNASRRGISTDNVLEMENEKQQIQLAQRSGFFKASEADDIDQVFFLSGTHSTSGTGSTTPGEKRPSKIPPVGIEPTPYGTPCISRQELLPTEPRRPMPVGFGFITFADPSGVDKVLAQGTHELDGKKKTSIRAFSNIPFEKNFYSHIILHTQKRIVEKRKNKCGPSAARVTYGPCIENYYFSIARDSQVKENFYSHIILHTQKRIVEKRKNKCGPSAARVTYGPCIENYYFSIARDSQVKELKFSLSAIIVGRLEAYTEGPAGLADSQYSFHKGRSTIDAIQTVLSTARSVISGKRWHRGTKEYCTIITLDVRNAFNSAQSNKIPIALSQMEVPAYLLRIVTSYFCDRVLEFTMDDGAETYYVTAGVPQGSVLGPILWNVMYDRILRIKLPEPAKIVGFADDIAVTVVAKHLDLVEFYSNETIRLVRAALTDLGLQTADQKTEVLLVTNRKVRETIIFRAGDHYIASAFCMQYLGVHIDARLLFDEYLRIVIDKANRVNRCSVESYAQYRRSK